jgi:hypothetical protein
LSDRRILAVSERSAAVWEYVTDVSHSTYPMSSLYPGTFSSTAYHKSIHNAPIAYHEFRDINSSTASNITPSITNSNISLSYYHMGYGGIGDIRKVLNIKNPTDAIYTPNNILLTTYENNIFYPQPTSSSSSSTTNFNNSTSLPSYLQQISRFSGSYESSRDPPTINTKHQKVIYCLSGHRIHSGFLPSALEVNGSSSSFGKRVINPKEVRLET